MQGQHVHYKYRGDDPTLAGCEAADLSLGKGPFKVSGTAFRKSLFPIAFVPVRRIFYTSWVGFIKDWGQTP